MSGDTSIDEKRVYGGSAGATAAFLATEAGLARVAVSDDIVGEFGLVRRGPAVDVAASRGRLAVATPEDVLVGAGESFVETGFGPADAVGYADGTLLAAGGGRVARYGEGWETLADLSGVRAIEGELVAAETGLHRLDGSHVGLAEARDVATAGRPLAATASGLYYLANGWMEAVDGDFEAVAAAGGRAHAATATTLYERADGGWRPLEVALDGAVADLAHGGAGGTEATYAVTESGTFLAEAGDGWRRRSLGLPGVARIAVP